MSTNVKRPWIGGCLIVVGFLLLPYMINAWTVVVPKLVFSSKWQALGWKGYVMTVNQTAFSPLAGHNVIRVEAGKVTSVLDSRCVQCSLSSFQELTVESIFRRADGCALLFPLLTCSFSYDPALGYPTHVEVNCPIADACYNWLQVENVSPLP
jgi:hypothetical protein